jgi:hypothetical protein
MQQVASSARDSHFPPSIHCYRPRCASRPPFSTQTVRVLCDIHPIKRLTASQSTRMAKSASPSSILLKRTSMATSLPPSAGHLSRHPKPSSYPSSPCSAVPTMNHRRTSRPRHCGGRTPPSSRSVLGSVYEIAWSLNKCGTWHQYDHVSWIYKGLFPEFAWRRTLTLDKRACYV